MNFHSHYAHWKPHMKYFWMKTSMTLQRWILVFLSTPQKSPTTYRPVQYSTVQSYLTLTQKRASPSSVTHIPFAIATRKKRNPQKFSGPRDYVMASTNGILSPPTQPHLDITLSAKRKRDDNIDQPALINGTSNESKIEIAKEPSTADTQGLVEDLIDVLKRWVLPFNTPFQSVHQVA